MKNKLKYEISFLQICDFFFSILNADIKLCFGFFVLFWSRQNLESYFLTLKLIILNSWFPLPFHYSLKVSFFSLPTLRFRPHQDGDPEKPRVAALIDRLIAFKNNDNGAWVRGGDIVVQNSAWVFSMKLLSDDTDVFILRLFLKTQ